MTSVDEKGQIAIGGDQLESMLDPGRFPGVTLTVSPRVDTADAIVTARLTMYGAAVAESTAGAIADAAAVAAEQVFIGAAAAALPFVGLDWSKLIRLGLRVVTAYGVIGEVTGVRKADETATIHWNVPGRPTTGTVSFQDVLERLEDRTWRVA